MLSISPVEGIICQGWQIKLARQDADASDPVMCTNRQQKLNPKRYQRKCSGTRRASCVGRPFCAYFFVAVDKKVSRRQGETQTQIHRQKANRRKAKLPNKCITNSEGKTTKYS